jgi:hypothetical protein
VAVKRHAASHTHKAASCRKAFFLCSVSIPIFIVVYPHGVSFLVLAWSEHFVMFLICTAVSFIDQN